MLILLIPILVPVHILLIFSFFLAWFDTIGCLDCPASAMMQGHAGPVYLRTTRNIVPEIHTLVASGVSSHSVLGTYLSSRYTRSLYTLPNQRRLQEHKGGRRRNLQPPRPRIRHRFVFALYSLTPSPHSLRGSLGLMFCQYSIAPLLELCSTVRNRQ